MSRDEKRRRKSRSGGGGGFGTTVVFIRDRVLILVHDDLRSERIPFTERDVYSKVLLHVAAAIDLGISANVYHSITQIYQWDRLNLGIRK